MLKATELRLDNLINLGGNTLDTYQTYKPVKVTLELLRDIKDENDERGNDYVLSVYQPIELTEEWLLKFGVKKTKCLFHLSYHIEILETDFYLRPCFKGGYYWGFNSKSGTQKDCELDDAFPIQYVHQLQNLYFALTGAEL